MAEKRVQFDWTPERSKTAADMWINGATGGDIAKLFGISRSAAIGKIHRLNLPKRISLISSPKQKASSRLKRANMENKPRTKPKPSKPTVAEHNPQTPPHDLLKPDNRALKSEAWMPLPGAAPISLLKLTDATCKWPIDDPVTGFCGHHTMDKPKGGSYSYCPEHQRRATQRPRDETQPSIRYKHSHIRIAPVKGIRA